MILAIDPGPEQSAFVRWDGREVITSGIWPNREYLSAIRDEGKATVAIEMVACYGMPVGKEVFETCLLIGRIQEICDRNRLDLQLVYRSEVKMHLCQSMRAKDSNIRRALIDRFGPPGTKREPGVLYGVKSHLWAALAIAVTAYDKAKSSPQESLERM